MIGETIHIALDAMRANLLRSMLATLGVVIGVAALVAILALSDGLERYTREQISRTTDLQTITVSPKTVDVLEGIAIQRADPVQLTDQDADDLARRLRGLGVSVAMFASGSGWTILTGDSVGVATLVMATTPAAQSMVPQRLIAGRFLHAADIPAAPVVVLSSALANALAPDPARLELLVDRQVEWAGGEASWTVVGILGAEPEDPVKRAWIPFSESNVTLLDPTGRRPPTIAIRADSVESVPDVTSSTEDWLSSRFGDDWDEALVLSVNRRRIAQVKQAALVFKMVMGAIAGISLLVGGIGIMNVLLASVSERTREIGTRKAVGARNRDVNLQFLVESLVISGTGSLVGTLTGFAGATAIATAVRRFTEAPVSAAFTWDSIWVAAAAALIIGVTFGTWPARRAARLSPVEALRDE